MSNSTEAIKAAVLVCFGITLHFAWTSLSSKSNSQEKPQRLSSESAARSSSTVSKHPTKLVKSKVPKSATPVLLITDIGADIDDTFAFLTLLGSQYTHLVGVVTAVNDGALRGSIARGWLRLAGYKDDEVPILPSVDPAVAGCVVPIGFPSTKESSLGVVANTPQAILDIAELYGSDLVIVAIAPITPLANACLIDKKGVLKKVQRIYFQGNVILDPQSKRLKPDPQAYNFRIHMGAAERVFEQLQDHVPFSFLGKFAAYEVGITRKELEAVDRQTRNGECFMDPQKDAKNIGITQSCKKELGRMTSEATSEWKLPCLATMAKLQMNKFRHGNFELWTKLYPVPPEFNDLNSMDWYDHLPNDVISHPYDPLLLLLVEEDNAQLSGHSIHSTKDINSNDVLSETRPKRMDISSNRNLYEKQLLGKVKLAAGMHIAVGNNKDGNCGIQDVERLKKVLLTVISKGLEKCSNASHNRK